MLCFSGCKLYSRLTKGFCVYSSSVKQCLPSVNHEQFPMQCKWHTSTTSDSKSSPRKIFHRNSSGARTPTSNSAWTTKEKTSTRNRRAERTSLSTAKATPTTRDRGTEEQETGTSEALWSVLHGGKLTFISLPVSSPIHRSKSKFQLCTTARSIIKKYDFHANCTAIFVLCFLVFFWIRWPKWC